MYSWPTGWQVSATVEVKDDRVEVVVSALALVKNRTKVLNSNLATQSASTQLILRKMYVSQQLLQYADLQNQAADVMMETNRSDNAVAGGRQGGQ